MAQEADDHACLLHALMWLLRIDDETNNNLSRMIDNFHHHSYETKVRYLEGVAYLNRSQFDVLHGEQLPQHHFMTVASSPRRY